MNIGIIMAMQKEKEFFAGQLKNFETQTIALREYITGKWHKHNITAVVCGMGKVNAAIGATHLIADFKTDLIINIGISGGLDASLNIGDFVLGTNITYHDVWCGEPYQHGQVQDMPLMYHSDDKLAAKLNMLKHGLLCCGDQFITSIDELQNIKQHFPQALAVDMESAAIAHVCFLHQIPFLCVRQISDTPGSEHHAEQYASFWDNAPKNSVKLLEQILSII